MRVLSACLAIVLAVTAVMPAYAGAQTISVTQTVTITATVAPSRSIVVDDQGKMLKIYSNTDQNVEPKVYLNAVPGEQRPLTPELLVKYRQIMAKQNKVIGVEIPVAQPVADEESTADFLFGRVSALFVKF